LTGGQDVLGIFQSTGTRLQLMDLGALTDGPARLVARLDGALKALEELASGFAAMREDVAGMRAGVEALSTQVDGLRSDVRGLYGSVDAIGSSMDGLDERLVELSRTLVAIDLIAARFARFGSRRRAPASVDDITPPAADS
jgi:hypothetical protein